MEEGVVSKQLPFFQPSDAFGRICVSDPSDRSGSKNNKPLFLNKKAVKHMPVNAAYREILQNMIDAIVEANGESFANLKITKEKRRGEQTAIVFHTDEHIFGEIVQDSKKISFVNMGPNIESVEQLLHFGASNKDEKSNQAGQHGEGLKRAALKFLTRGYRVDAYFTLNINQEAEFRHLTFKINDKHECLAYSLAAVNPFERFKKSDDHHRFELNIRTGDHNPVFDIGKLMLTDPKLVRGMKDEHDVGTLLLDPKESGLIYVWHFYICGYQNVMFGYDLFLARINRDRNDINFDVLCDSIAAIWSEAIVNSEEMAQTFYNHLLMNVDAKTTVEVRSFPKFSLEAANVIAHIFRTRNPSPWPLRPIRGGDTHLLHSQFDARYFIVVPDQAMDIFNLIFTNLSDDLSRIVAEFAGVESIPFDDDIQDIFRGIAKMYEACVSHLPVKYFVDNTGDTLTIVLNKPKNYFEEKYWNRIIFEFLPQIMKDFDLGIDNTFEFLSKISSKYRPQQPPQHRQEPPKNPAVEIIVYSEEPEDEYVPEEDYGGEENPEDYDGEEEEPNEEEEVQPSRKRLKPSPPPGYKFYDGPKLMIKL